MAVQSDICLRNTFPVMSGGSKDETMKCLVFDEVNEQIIVGGSTLSNDYGPSLSQTGFMYAVDLAGNWRWGNYYFSSSAITDITGCSLSTDKQQTVVMGISLGKPVLLTLNNVDGRATNVIQATANQTPQPTIRTFGAVLFDNANPRLPSSFYFSYIAAEKLMISSIMEQDTSRSNWNYEFEDLSVVQESNDFYRKKLPLLLTENPLGDQSTFLLGGQYRGAGTLMHFHKRNGLLKQATQIDAITRVQAVVSTNHPQFFMGCGQNNFSDRSRSVGSVDNEAWIFRVNDLGSVEWMRKIAGDKPTGGSRASDNCIGLSFNAEDGLTTALIQTMSPQLR